MPEAPVAPAAPQDTRAAAELTYRAVRDQILSGERVGGQWLRETDLAAELGVSRTPVREALRRLVAEGLVRHEPNRGVQVQSWSVADLDEIFSLRAVLEPWGSGLAATGGTADLPLLEELARGMDEAASGPEPDLAAVTELNNRFHRAILEASGNSRLVSLMASVVQVPLVLRTFSLYTPESLRRSLAHHHELVDALRARDPDWAESVMRSHVRSAWTSLRPRAVEESAG
jgi:DNA-binding GntR family transcriptional regulator